MPFMPSVAGEHGTSLGPLVVMPALPAAVLGLPALALPALALPPLAVLPPLTNALPALAALTLPPVAARPPLPSKKSTELLAPQPTMQLEPTVSNIAATKSRITENYYAAARAHSRGE